MSAQVAFSHHGSNPDVLTCIANVSDDDVFTSPELAIRMQDLRAEALSVADWRLLVN